ncbi:hypothetical protein [Roseovarius sp. EL26]|uniref:hypothetical protein n=1 Tax=Roseovarius sp. EL26 TaxID=2126672 RepID=UPI000EA2A3DD|nr:hypothetical protein [Roseovarius sp. EL26]
MNQGLQGQILREPPDSVEPADLGRKRADSEDANVGFCAFLSLRTSYSTGQIGLAVKFRCLKHKLWLLICQRPRAEQHDTRSKTWPDHRMTDPERPIATALPREHWAALSPL